jgi:hypothetical protein
LAGNGRSATACESAVMAAFCCSVSGAFCNRESETREPQIRSTRPLIAPERRRGGGGKGVEAGTDLLPRVREVVALGDSPRLGQGRLRCRHGHPPRELAPNWRGFFSAATP